VQFTIARTTFIRVYILSKLRDCVVVVWVKIKNYLLTFVALICVFPKAHADDFTLVNKASFLSEYHSRGISQTQGSPAPQFSSTVFHKSGAFTGIYVSRVEFLDNDEADLEVDLLLGFHKTIDKLYCRIGAIYYVYPDADSSLEYNFWELDLGLGYNFDSFYSELSLRRSPNHFASSGEMRYVKLETSVPIIQNQLKLKTHIAHRYIEDNQAFFNIPDSFDWEIGFEHQPIENLDLIIKYVDSSLTRKECLNSDLCRERLIAGISYHF